MLHSLAVAVLRICNEIIKQFNSASFGSYTKRERIIFVAVRNDVGIEYIYPTPLYKNEADYLTVGDALKIPLYALQ